MQQSPTSRDVLAWKFRAHLHAAMRKVFETYCRNLQGHELNADDLCLVFHLSAGAQPRGELESALSLVVADAAQTIARMERLGYVAASNEDLLDFSERGEDVLKQVQQLAQTANVRWRADAASAAPSAELLPRLLAMLQSAPSE